MRDDPRWNRMRYQTTCTRCGRTIRKGEQAFFYPLTRSTYCTGEDCGLRADREFEAARFDEVAR